MFDHDEEMVCYVLKAAENGKRVIHVLSDDTDVFVLLVYWVYRADLELLCKVQMERWDRTVLYINATSVDLGLKCLQLLGMHALSGCVHLVSIWQREDQWAKYPACSRLPRCAG